MLYVDKAAFLNWAPQMESEAVGGWHPVKGGVGWPVHHEPSRLMGDACSDTAHIPKTA